MHSVQVVFKQIQESLITTVQQKQAGSEGIPINHWKVNISVMTSLSDLVTSHPAQYRIIFFF